MFACKVCTAKDAHLKALETEINYLRELVLPTQTGTSLGLREVDALLSGHQNIIDISPEEEAEIKQAQEQEIAETRERDQLLSGAY